MNEIQKWSGVVALVVLAIIGLVHVFSKGAGSLAGTTSCGSITCLEGGLRLVSDVGGAFESDIAATFASTVAITGATTLTGSTTETAGISIAGRPAITVTNAKFCMNIFATSTNTQGSVTFAASTTAPTNGSGVIAVFAYGACS